MMSVISYRAPAPGWWVRPRHTDHPSATGGPLGVCWGLWFSTGHIGNLGGAVLLVVTMIGGLTHFVGASRDAGHLALLWIMGAMKNNSAFHTLAVPFSHSRK